MNYTCHDCGAKEGQIHELGCDMETCPFCSSQLLSCDCVYENLAPLYGWKLDDEAMFGGLPEDVYNNGLTEEMEQKWIEILNKKGRIPYICWPIICSRCGKKWPNLFMVPDWGRYVEPEHRRDVLCRECFDKIKSKIDKYGTKMQWESNMIEW